MSKWQNSNPGDIDLGDGTTYVLIFDTTAYAGNFEREMAGYVGGVGEIRGDAERAAFEEDMEDDPRLEDIQGLFKMVDHKEYGSEEAGYIWATPNRYNNGYGKCGDLTPELIESGKYFPAYESVAMFLETGPSAAEMAIIRARAEEFASREGFQIKGVRLLKYERETRVVEQTVEVDFERI